MIKLSNFVRWGASLALLTLLWVGYPWAEKLIITLLAIALELQYIEKKL